MSDLRLYSSQGHGIDEMRAPEGKPTFVPTAEQEQFDRVRNFFLEGVRLVVDADRLWAYVRARRRPSACTEQYYASVGVDGDLSIPDRPPPGPPRDG